MIDKVKPYYSGVSERPLIIVGEKINKQRPDHWGYGYALLGNKTGDFIEEAIFGYSNLILTNVVNRYYPGDFDPKKFIAEGLTDLIHMIEHENPSRIIALGGIAQKYVHSMVVPDDCDIVDFPHPAWINRFKSGYRHEYINQLQKHIYDDESIKRIRTNPAVGKGAGALRQRQSPKSNS